MIIDSYISDISDAPIMEPGRQFYFIEKASKLISLIEEERGHKLTYHVQTFGCQMNFKDSEKLCGVFESIGLEASESENSDVVIYNTCTVRENANTRVYGRIGYLGKLKKQNKDMIIGLCGCMMQEPTVVEKIKNSYSFVDLIFGTHNIYKLAELFFQLLLQKEQIKNSKNKKFKTLVDIWEGTDTIVEELPSVLKKSFKAGVNIMFGCNNFCSYCIVPYVRGRERSRKPEDIIDEVRKLVSNGVIEVMLLGQNVNSYGKTLENPISFAELLRRVNEIEGLKRIRFMTSHPKDLSDELIQAMAECDKVCKHIHLPLQSGSSRVLKIMNRRYTKEDYLNLISKLRKAMPDIAITTDIIVGFPSETEEDFTETLEVCQQVEYDSAYTFIYSKRTGTPAASMPDQIPEDVIKNRFDRLLNVINECSNKRALALEGKTVPVLVEEEDRETYNKSYICKPGNILLTGRLDNNLLVHFEGSSDLIGSIINIRLSECKGFYYIGEVQL